MSEEESVEQVNLEESYDDLPIGTQLLHGQYTIEQFLNAGGFGVTYLAKDSLERTVVIKECFPSSVCRRSEALVHARSRAYGRELESIIQLFVGEARTLSKLHHPNIVGVHQVFEENGTAYMALDYVDGNDLVTIIEDGEVELSPATIQGMLKDLLSATQAIHSVGILHRDISPDNILLDQDMRPILIDFGAARESAVRKSRMLSAMRVVKDGYSPYEFYISDSKQGPYSDLYSLAASFYHVISGDIPPESQSRLGTLASGTDDPCTPLAGRFPEYDETFLKSIDKAMSILPQDRPQTADEWQEMLDGTMSMEGNVHAEAIRGDDKVTQKIADAIGAKEGEGQNPMMLGADQAVDGDTASSEEAQEYLGENVRPKRPVSKRTSTSIRPQTALRETEPKKTSQMTLFGSIAAGVVLAGVLGVALTSGGSDDDLSSETAEAPFSTGDTSEEQLTLDIANEDGTAIAGLGPDAEESTLDLGLPVFDENTVAENSIEESVDESPEPAPQVAETTPPSSSANEDPETPIISKFASAKFPAPELLAALPFGGAPRATEIEALGIDFGDIVSSWSVGLPESLSVEPGASEQTIFEVNGVDVSSETEFLEALSSTVQPGDEPRVVVEMLTGASSDDTNQRLLQLPVVQRTGSPDGIMIETFYSGQSWVSIVAAVSENTETELQVGDLLLAVPGANELLDTRLAFPNAMHREAVDGAEAVEVAVLREGSIWVGSLSIDDIRER